MRDSRIRRGRQAESGTVTNADRYRWTWEILLTERHALESVPMTIDAIFTDHYCLHRRTGKHTRCTMQSHLRRWRSIIDADAERITLGEFTRFRADALAQGFSPDTIEGTVRVVMQILRLACRLDLIGKVPYSGTPLATRQTPRHKTPLDTLGRLYLATHVAQWPVNQDAPLFWRCVLVLGYFTGLRWMDLWTRLTWGSVGDESITVTAGKTGKTHCFPMHPVVKRHLDCLPRLGPRVFQTGLSNMQWGRELKRINAAAQVEPAVTMHAIRALSATSWQRAKWGAGEVVQGSAIRGSAKMYIDVPPILIDAVDRLAWPSVMLTARERDAGVQAELQMLAAFRRLGERDRFGVLAFAERLA